MAVLTLLTRPLVQWDQLALWAVTTGSGMSGYWYAGFDNGVRFVLVGNTEVTQGQYAPMLLMYLIAPMLGAVALIITTVQLARGARSANRGDGLGRRAPNARTESRPRR